MPTGIVASGREIDCSPSLADHVRLNRYYMSIDDRDNVSLYDALIDLFSDPVKFSYAVMGGMEIPDILYRCGGCGNLYTTDWELVAEGNGKKVFDGEIPVNLSWRDESGFHYIESVEISGARCIPCFRRHEDSRRRSIESARKDPFWWMESLYSRIFPKHIREVPDDVRAELAHLMVD